MNAGHWIQLGVWAFILGFTSLLGWWSIHRPNKVKRLRGAVRQPVLIGVIGWATLVIGAMFIPFSFSSSLDPDENWPMRICGTVLFLAGFTLVAIYINWWVLIDDEKIVQRTLFRNILCIRYEDVDRHQLYRNGAIPMLKLWGIDGTVIQLNSGAFDTGPVIDGIYRHRLDQDGPDYARFRNPPEPVP